MKKLHWNKLIVSLDVDNKNAIKRIVADLPKVTIYKVGLIPFVMGGPELVEFLIKKRKKVFLDLKFYDIPNTMSEALKIVMRLKIWGLTVHASNTEDALQTLAATAQETGKNKPLIIGVTQLTSKECSQEEVISLAEKARRAGLSGVVASAREAAALKEKLGKAFLVFTPGVRPAEDKDKDDQKRVTTFSEALQNGADYMIVGRPIIKGPDYKKNAECILKG